MKNITKILTVSIFLFTVSVCLMIFAAEVPAFAQWYSQHIYSLIVFVFGRFWGLFPFSVSEIMIYTLIVIFIISFLILLVKMIRSKLKRCYKGADLFASWISKVLLAAGILVFLYTICCGINYHRQPFSEVEGITTYNYDVDNLTQICLWLTEEVNARCDNVQRNEDGILVLEASEKEGSVEAMNDLAVRFSSLKGYYPYPKQLLFSEVLSLQGLTGIYLPFTVEANYNGDMTSYNKPFTACHELSRLRGFMQEQEANFIAFLACIGSERTDFQYSGYLTGWVYCMNTLYRADYESWQKVRSLLNINAVSDLNANTEFWEKYEGKISETADQINDTYLKVNGQVDGVQSYNRMVDLIIAYFS